MIFFTKTERRWIRLKKMRKRHPDYLGHNELITDRSGSPYQYFHYTAWGESFAQAVHCLEIYVLEIDLLINFGSKSLEFKRVQNKKFKQAKQANQTNPEITKNQSSDK